MKFQMDVWSASTREPNVKSPMSGNSQQVLSYLLGLKADDLSALSAQLEKASTSDVCHTVSLALIILGGRTFQGHSCFA